MSLSERYSPRGRLACYMPSSGWTWVSHVTYVMGPPRSCGQQDDCSAGKRRNLPKKQLRSGLLRNSSGTIDQTRLLTLMLTSRCVTVCRPPVFSNRVRVVKMFHRLWTHDARSSGFVSGGTREGTKNPRVHGLDVEVPGLSRGETMRGRP